jgi:predicted nucleic acid-binding protein
MTFLDTNVFIYAAGRESDYKGPCTQILADVARSKGPGPFERRN